MYDESTGTAVPMTADELRNARKYLGLTLTAACHAVSVSRRSFIRYEQGDSPVPSGVAEAMRQLRLQGPIGAVHTRPWTIRLPVDLLRRLNARVVTLNASRRGPRWSRVALVVDVLTHAAESWEGNGS